MVQEIYPKTISFPGALANDKKMQDSQRSRDDNSNALECYGSEGQSKSRLQKEIGDGIQRNIVPSDWTDLHHCLAQPSP